MLVRYPAMTIMLVVASFALVLLLAGLGVFVATLIAGVGLACVRQTRFLAPVFLLIIPLTALGAVGGAFGIGACLIRLNGDLLFWGPALGLVVGSIIGSATGSFFAAIIWWRAYRKAG
jgi:hypothetical protein